MLQRAKQFYFAFDLANGVGRASVHHLHRVVPSRIVLHAVHHRESAFGHSVLRISLHSQCHLGHIFLPIEHKPRVQRVFLAQHRSEPAPQTIPHAAQPVRSLYASLAPRSPTSHIVVHLRRDLDLEKVADSVQQRIDSIVLPRTRRVTFRVLRRLRVQVLARVRVPEAPRVFLPRPRGLASLDRLAEVFERRVHVGSRVRFGRSRREPQEIVAHLAVVRVGVVTRLLRVLRLALLLLLATRTADATAGGADRKGVLESRRGGERTGMGSIFRIRPVLRGWIVVEACETTSLEISCGWARGEGGEKRVLEGAEPSSLQPVDARSKAITRHGLFEGDLELCVDAVCLGTSSQSSQSSVPRIRFTVETITLLSGPSRRGGLHFSWRRAPIVIPIVLYVDHENGKNDILFADFDVERLETTFFSTKLSSSSDQVSTTIQ